jgi:hypothetical protein
MPQISLRISKNIEMNQVDFQKLFVAIHHALRDVPDLDIKTCHSGVIQEDFSYIGLGDDRLTKMFLEIYWLESEKRIAIKNDVALKLMKILEDIIVPQIEKQNLICIPRVRIVDLGKLGQDYHISKRS